MKILEKGIEKDRIHEHGSHAGVTVKSRRAS
jgi:hypothetical protein